MFNWRRPREIAEPPPSLNTEIIEANSELQPAPLTYVFTQRREPQEGPQFLTAPDSQYQALLPLDIAWQEAPDPIRQSDYYDYGNKIHPDAQMPITSHLAIASWLAVMQDQFQVGKLLGYWHRPMFAGGQLPSIPRTNIQEAMPTTYGAMYEVQPTMQSPGVITPTGFAANYEQFSDYPY
jgi:hypothetical protein